MADVVSCLVAAGLAKLFSGTVRDDSSEKSRVSGILSYRVDDLISVGDEFDALYLHDWSSWEALVCNKNETQASRWIRPQMLATVRAKSKKEFF